LNSRFLFKKALPEDAPVIYRLANKIWKNYYPAIISKAQIDYMLDRMYSPAHIQQQILNGETFTLVYEEQEVFGFLSITLKGNKNYFLHKFYVDTFRHREGIGAVLFNAVLSELNGAERIELTVNRMNFKAINFYFKMGFRILRCEEFDIGGGYFMNDFVMFWLKK
jgi:ribosomal protein S18 acetylase RimI-like enzyme